MSKIFEAKFLVYSVLLIIAISFIVLFPSFKLAFQDDDWRGVVLPKTDYADGRLFTPYGIQLWFCGLLYDSFDSNFYLYYILSFVLRILVAFGVLLFSYRLTKNHPAALFAGILTVVGFSGLQTTFEIANTNVYIAVIFFLIFLNSFFLNRDKLSIKHLVLMIVSISLATLASPVRTYPIYGWAFLVDLIWLVMNFGRTQLNIFFVRQLLLSGTFFVLYKLGLFSWFSLDHPDQNKYDNFGRFFSEVGFFLKELNPDISLNFLKGLGNIVLPSLLDTSSTLATIAGGIFLISLVLLAILAIKKKNIHSYIMFSFLLWPLVLYASYFIVYLASYTSGKDTIFLDSVRRYLFPPFTGFSIVLALLLSISLKRKSILRNTVLIFYLFLVLTHSFSTYSYLNKLSKQRDGYYMATVWKQIKQLVPENSLHYDKTNIFYFETDGTERAIYTVNDGFIPHATALYKIDGKFPSLSPQDISSFNKSLAPPILSFEVLNSYILKSLAENPEPDIWMRIFALKIEGERVRDIKENIRNKIESSSNTQ